MNNEAPEQPRNDLGELLFPESVVMVACNQCSKATPWPLTCGHDYAEIHTQDYRRVDPPAAPTDDLKKRARQIIDAVFASPCVVETRCFSQPEEIDRLEEQVVALLTKSLVAPAAPDERDWHPFLQYPLGRFRKPEDDIGKCWFVINHHYCGLPADAAIHQAPIPADERDAARTVEVINAWRAQNKPISEELKKSPAAVAKLCEMIDELLATVRAEVWRDAIQIARDALHEHPSPDMQELCGHNGTIKQIIAALESARGKVEG